MNEPKENNMDTTIIVKQIAELSRLLGMIPSDDTITIEEPVTHNSMQLSDWLAETRDSLLRLSIQLDKVLGLNLR